MLDPDQIPLSALLQVQKIFKLLYLAYTRIRSAVATNDWVAMDIKCRKVDHKNMSMERQNLTDKQ